MSSVSSWSSAVWAVTTASRPGAPRGGARNSRRSDAQPVLAGEPAARACARVCPSAPR